MIALHARWRELNDDIALINARLSEDPTDSRSWLRLHTLEDERREIEDFINSTI